MESQITTRRRCFHAEITGISRWGKVGGKVVIREERKEKKKSRERDGKEGEYEMMGNAVNVFFDGDGEPFTTPIFTTWVTALKSAAYIAGNMFKT